MSAAATDIPPVMAEGLRALIGRLTDLLRRECDDLRANRLDGLEEFARQKDLLLLDITRLLNASPGARALTPHLISELQGLQEALTHNRELIDRHLAAAREFAGFVEDAIRRRQADGTYSRRLGAPRDDPARNADRPDAAARVRKAYGKW